MSKGIIEARRNGLRLSHERFIHICYKDALLQKLHIKMTFTWYDFCWASYWLNNKRNKSTISVSVYNQAKI